MKKIILLSLASLFLMSSAAFAIKDQIKVEIVAPSEDKAVKTRDEGWIGAFEGTKTTELVYMVNAKINGDHARLKCYENHRGCTAIGPGMYDADIDAKSGDVWITIVVPVSHKIIRDHWRVAGTW